MPSTYRTLDGPATTAADILRPLDGPAAARVELDALTDRAASRPSALVHAVYATAADRVTIAETVAMRWAAGHATRSELDAAASVALATVGALADTLDDHERVSRIAARRPLVVR